MNKTRRSGQTTRFGRLAEQAVADFLEANGWTILGRNVRDGPREIDLVVRRSSVVAFVEVKARAQDDGTAVASVDWRKRRHVVRAARAWVGQHGRPGTEYRFDVAIAHPGPGGAFDIRIIPDAWRIES